MGTYIDKGNNAFREIRNGEYVDKSELIAVVNKTLSTEQKFSCVTRCRRFGKSMAAKMLAAYYDRSCDSRSLFADLEIASDPTFEQHLNKYPVLYLDLSAFTRELGKGSIVKRMEKELIADIHTAYSNVPVPRGGDLMKYLLRILAATGDRFVFIIDEWDVVLRECAQNPKLKTRAKDEIDDYVGWLRRMFKDITGTDVFLGVYMTGILPIKKYPTESALNNFTEYSMVSPRKMARYFGFTINEVQALAEKHGMDFDEMKKWYDGYQIGSEPSMFNPNSVMQAIDSEVCESYWSATGSFASVANYINRDFDGLRDSIIDMLGGGRCKVDPTSFQNDMREVHSRDEVFTVLIHLGYLSFNRSKNECYIPNREVAGEMVNAVKANRWQHVATALQQSDDLLQATLEGDSDTVAHMVDAAHSEHTSILSYYNENSMACVLSIAYYAAHDEYVFHRELASGKGFADLVLLPRKNVDKPAIVLELKKDKDAVAAIDQIRKKDYPAKVAQYMAGEPNRSLLLVGINFDKKTKTHECCIETYTDEQ